MKYYNYYFLRETNQGLLLDTPDTKLEKNVNQRKDPFSPFDIPQRERDSVFKPSMEGFSWLECMGKDKSR